MQNNRDEDIKKDIVDELYWDSRIDASKINVTVKNGEVMLTGEVQNFGDISIVRAIAWRRQGVMDVTDRLEVINLAPTPLPNDEEIQGRAENILAWDTIVDETEIGVSVLDGIVTLHGTIDAHWKKSIIENKIAGMRGVFMIENKLAVVPTHRIDDEIIARDVMAALDRDPQVETARVTVEVNNGIVRLSGDVAQWSTKHYAHIDASRTAGVVEIINELRLVR